MEICIVMQFVQNELHNIVSRPFMCLQTVIYIGKINWMLTTEILSVYETIIRETAKK